MKQLLCGTHKRGRVIGINRVVYTRMDLSWIVIVLATQTWISHQVHVYYMIELFNVFRSVSYALYGILATRNIYLSLWDLLSPLKLIFESDIKFSTCTYPLTTCMVQRYIHSLTLTPSTPWKSILKGTKPCGGGPYLFQGRVNIIKWNSQVRTFSFILS